MSLQRSKNQEIHIPLYYIEKEYPGYTKIMVLEEEKAKKIMATEDNKIKVSCLNTYWVSLTFGDSNFIKNSSRINTPDGVPMLDVIKMRELKIKSALRKWDLKDANGADVPVSPAMVETLPDEIVDILLQKYMDITSISEYDEKN